MGYEIERKGRAYQVRDVQDEHGNGPIVFGPRRKADCRKWVRDNEAIEAQPKLQLLQELAQTIVSRPALVKALRNHTCHALENQAAAHRGATIPWAFNYSCETMTDPRDITSEKAALHALRCAWIELVDLGVDDYPGAVRDPLYDAVHFDCGHLPERRGDDQMNEAGDRETGETICYDCADKRHVQDLDTATETGGYLAKRQTGEAIGNMGPRYEYEVTTWTGGFLMRAFNVNTTKRYGFGGVPYDDVTFTARDAKGRTWFGRGPGVGMYCRLRLSAADRRAR